MTFPILFAVWLQLTSPNFEVLTDAGERAGRDLASQMEMIRYVFEPVGVSPLPVRVVLFRSESGFNPYRQASSTKGFFQSGPDRNYIVLVQSDEETRRVAYHEYIHLVLNHSSGPLPKWLEEGAAEYYSTISPRGSPGRSPTANRLAVGLPIRNHLSLLARSRRLSAREMAAVSEDSPLYNEADKVGVFYAQSWAVVHRIYSDGQISYNQSFTEEYLESRLNNLDAYLAAPLRVLSVAWTPPPDVSIEATALDSIEETAALVDLALRTGSHGHAARLLERLRRDNPNSAWVAFELALLDLANGDKPAALGGLERAISLPGAPAHAYFEYAMLLRDTGAPSDERRQRVRSLLAEAAGRNPNHAEANFVLGLMLASDGRHSEAIPYLERAATILPRQKSFRDTLNASRAALAKSAPPTGAQNQAKPREPVRTPSSWTQPKGDAQIEGLLERVDCEGLSARIHVRGRSGVRALHIDNPGRLLLNDAASVTAEFACGPQRPPRPVLVEFISATGVVTALRFRESPGASR
jgi:tetratricopeptide (TPR) repeat protein